MSIRDDVIVERQAEEFMKQAPDQRERLLYVAILRTDLLVQEINVNGCKRRCTTSLSAILDRWTPAAIGTAISAALIAFFEYFRGSHVP